MPTKKYTVITEDSTRNGLRRQTINIKCRKQYLAFFHFTEVSHDEWILTTVEMVAGDTLGAAISFTNRIRAIVRRQQMEELGFSIGTTLKEFHRAFETL